MHKLRLIFVSIRTNKFSTGSTTVKDQLISSERSDDKTKQTVTYQGVE